MEGVPPQAGADDGVKVPAKFVNGRLSLDPVEETIAAREYGDKPLILDIEPVGARRSVRANARYWSVLIPLAQHCLNLKRPGMLPLNAKQVHALLVTAFLGSEDTPLGPVPMTTHDKDSKTFGRLTEQTTLWLREQGYPVPEGRDKSVSDAIGEAMA